MAFLDTEKVVKKKATVEINTSDFLKETTRKAEGKEANVNKDEEDVAREFE